MAPRKRRRTSRLRRRFPRTRFARWWLARFLKELASNTNPNKAPRLLNWISEEKIRALGFMSKLKYETDPELVGKYVEAEDSERRKEWLDLKGWDFRIESRPTSTRSGCL